MANGNPQKPLSDSFKKLLGRAAFSGNLRDDLKIFDQCSYDEIIALFPDRATLHEQLQEIAFQEKAVIFGKIVALFGEDEDAMTAIVAGFSRDEKFTNNRDNYSDWGPSPDPDDFAKKRHILQQFAIDIHRRDSAADKTVEGSQTPILIRKFKPR